MGHVESAGMNRAVTAANVRGATAVTAAESTVSVCSSCFAHIKAVILKYFPRRRPGANVSRKTRKSECKTAKLIFYSQMLTNEEEQDLPVEEDARTFPDPSDASADVVTDPTSTAAVVRTWMNAYIIRVVLGKAVLTPSAPSSADAHGKYFITVLLAMTFIFRTRLLFSYDSLFCYSTCLSTSIVFGPTIS